MPLNLRGRHLLTLKDFSAEEIRYLLDLSVDLKRKKRAGVRTRLLDGKNVVLIFDKASTRTRCAFEVAVYDEGGHVTFLSNSQMGKKESLEDTARVLGRYYDGIEYRGFSQETAELLARNAGVPVWNGLTDTDHPTQILADFMTITEHLAKPLHQVKLAFMGDTRNNMARAMMIGAAKLGMQYVGIGPRELFPDDATVQEIEAIAGESGARIEHTDSVEEGLSGADVIYTDVWVSMGEGDEQFERRVKLLKPYQVDMDAVRKTGNPEVLFLHCLPAFHDTETQIGAEIAAKFGLQEMEVTDEVFRSKHSKVFDEAENRMHTIKAVMVATIGTL